MNPGLSGCTKVSAGCAHCYAEPMHKRLVAMGVYPPESRWGSVEVAPLDVLRRRFAALPKRKPKRVFVTSMSDLFHRDVPFAWIEQVFLEMEGRPHHQFQVLTKRPDRMADFAAWRGRHWPTNVWAGTSCEDQDRANERIPHLLRVPSLIRFLSCEPLLGPIDLRRIESWASPRYSVDVLRFGTWDMGGGFTNHSDMHSLYGREVSWVIAGGESGTAARPMHPAWARSLRDQCEGTRAAFFFKQWGAWKPVGPVYPVDAHAELDLEAHDETVAELLRHPTHVALEPTGTQAQGATKGVDWCSHRPRQGAWWMARGRKDDHGRLLDGRRWEEFPLERGGSPLPVRGGARDGVL